MYILNRKSCEIVSWKLKKPRKIVIIKWQKCHNSKKNLITICDFAYQGLGEGIENDAIGVRTLLKKLDNLIICSSYSKNFGLYSERVGCLIYHSKNMNNYSSVPVSYTHLRAHET